MSEYHIGCGLAGIYAGVLNPKNQSEWKDKSECTEQAIAAVRDYMIDDCLGGLRCTKGTSGGYLWNLRDGRTLRLRVEMSDPHNPFDSNSNAC